MVNVLLFSANEDYKSDLAEQITRYVEGAVISASAPDVIVVDEDRNLYNQNRSKYPSIPMILLTDSSSQTKNDNLNLTISKPFSLMGFLDIIRAANNKLDSSADGFLKFNDYELHPNQKEIIDLTNNSTVKLTEKEVCIIKYLYRIHGKYASKTDLQKNVWQYNENVTTHTVETHVYRLRQKVENGDRRLIVTDNGKYKLNTD